MSSKSSVEFKGTKEGIVLQLDSEMEFSEVLLKLEEKISKSAGFFKGAEIIGLDGRTASASEKKQLEALLIEKAEMSIKSLALITKPAPKSTKAATAAVSVTADTPIPQPVEKPVPETPSDAMFVGLKEGPTQFVRGTMRSGRSVVFKGNVVVLGDVNPGAEIIADGNIVVMGHLRGVAHAGANGNHDAYVCANQLNPTQLRIGKLITRPPDETDGADPEIAIVKGDMIVIEPYLM